MSMEKDKNLECTPLMVDMNDQENLIEAKDEYI
jgi:hypothetical protein